MIDEETPLVSVIIPTYNHGRYLGRALQSVIDQTFTNWEVIVIDNHSTDNTDEVVASFSSHRITYLKIHNEGVIATSRNAGIRAAKGDWVAFLDSDDWWTNDKLQACFSCISAEIDLVYHDLEIVADQPRPFRRKIIKSWQVKEPVLMDLLVKGNAIANSSVVVRKNLLEKIDGINESVEMVAAEDYNTWLRIAALTNRFMYLPLKFGFYFIHNQSISKKDMSVPVRYAVKEFMPMLTSEQKNKIEANFRYTSGRFNFVMGNNAVANNDLKFSLRYCKISLKVKSMWMIAVIRLVR